MGSDLLRGPGVFSPTPIIALEPRTVSSHTICCYSVVSEGPAASWRAWRAECMRGVCLRCSPRRRATPRQSARGPRRPSAWGGRRAGGRSGRKPPRSRPWRSCGRRESARPAARKSGAPLPPSFTLSPRPVCWCMLGYASCCCAVLCCAVQAVSSPVRSCLFASLRWPCSLKFPIALLRSLFRVQHPQAGGLGGAGG
jgi:hypothetical protein